MNFSTIVEVFGNYVLKYLKIITNETIILIGKGIIPFVAVFLGAFFAYKFNQKNILRQEKRTVLNYLVAPEKVIFHKSVKYC
ncbi:MAG: hypothetical protein A2252_02965 [Elusimicrobia bacterium RIFOXYA2_FULL_39_19]|nr:MAG: hypothetical protein A2252_02965 [Elusimicrobia bacterium RIFOXYA2_FULL_39_19]